MTAVVDENGAPLEVIIPWAQYCEMSEALGLDLNEEALTDLREARTDLLNGDKTAFRPAA